MIPVRLEIEKAAANKCAAKNNAIKDINKKGKRIAVVINKPRTFPLVKGYALCHLNNGKNQVSMWISMYQRLVCVAQFKLFFLQQSACEMYVSFKLSVLQEIVSIKSNHNVLAHNINSSI